MPALLKSTLLALVLAAAALLPAATPAASEEWWEKIINDGKRQSAAAARPSRSASNSSATASRTARSKQRSEPRESRDTGSGGEVGVASYYWQPQPVASGGRFDPNAWTAAHKTLPFGTRVRVTRLDNGNSVSVTINDRGPYVSGRVIDLSRRAAQSIAMTGVGVTRVRVNVIGRG